MVAVWLRRESERGGGLIEIRISELDEVDGTAATLMSVAPRGRIEEETRFVLGCAYECLEDNERAAQWFELTCTRSDGRGATLRVHVRR